MNLLSLTGALLTASASVLNHPIKENHQNKMMDVEYKYESNEVNTINDLIFGHVYQFDFISEGDYFSDFLDIYNAEIQIKFFQTYDIYIEANNLDEALIYENYLTPDICITLYNDSSYTQVILKTSYSSEYSYVTDNAIEFYFANAYENVPFQLISYQLYSGGYIDVSNISSTSYNEIVPSSSHRGNLYTTLYDFFYGIFDTSDTNELSMTIMGQNMNLTSWLAHTVTIALLLLGVLWLILVIRWIFRVFSGLVKI